MQDSLVVRCVKAGGDTLALYGYSAAEGASVDLLDAGTPDSLRASDYATAWNMTHDAGFELAAKIVAGEWEIVRAFEAAPE